MRARVSETPSRAETSEFHFVFACILHINASGSINTARNSARAMSLESINSKKFLRLKLLMQLRMRIAIRKNR
jgi:hypothetical protein